VPLFLNSSDQERVEDENKGDPSWQRWCDVV